MLLDLHPEPEWPRLEVHVGDRITAIGDLDTTGNVAKVLTARRVLASLIDDGLFIAERVTRFEFRYHFSSVDAWLAYMTENWTSATIAPAQVTRAREVLAEATGTLVICEQVHAARYRRGHSQPDSRA